MRGRRNAFTRFADRGTFGSLRTGGGSVGELSDFQIDEDVAAQQAVVENQVDEEVLFVEGEALLARFEEETLAEFEQEMLDAGDDGGF
jgi:hypothetical protein